MKMWRLENWYGDTSAEKTEHMIFLDIDWQPCVNIKEHKQT